MLGYKKQSISNISGMTIVIFHQIYVYYIIKFVNVEFIGSKFVNLLMLTYPCNICWLRKAVIGYYKSYKVNTHNSQRI